MNRKNNRRRRRSKFARVLRLEALEERRVLTTFVVDNLLDGPVNQAGDLPGSLRQAIFDANANPGADTITFANELAGSTITLTQNGLAIQDSVSILGLGADQLTISGDNQFAVFLGTGQITIMDLTIADGLAGANFNSGDVTFRRVFMTGNGSPANSGSTIEANFGRLIIEDSAIVNATGVDGALRLQDMQTTITNTTISGNATAGISVFNFNAGEDRLLLNSVTIANNAGDGIEVVANNSTTLIEYQNTLFSSSPDHRSISAQANDAGLPGLSIISLGHNLLDDTPEGLAAHDAALGDLRDADPMLLPLAENGGPTPTHALLPGSPAIDAGSVGGTFTDQQVVSDSETGALSVSAADINGDGLLDVVSSRGNELVWHENDGAENFTERSISTFDANVSASIAADLDSDGDVDVISATNFQNGVTNRGVFWHENDGSGNFFRRSVSSAGVVNRVESLFVSDVDGDGHQDIVAISQSTSGNTVFVLENNGSQSFTVRPVGAASFGTSVFAADVDSDGDIDVLSASRNDDKIAWYENRGGLTFVEHVISTSANGGRGVFAIDVDGDGDIDVLSASNQDSKVAWYENDGNENFTEQVISTSDRGAFAVFAADYDEDGDIDVLSSAVGNGQLVLHVNDGSENFTERRFGSGLVNARDIFTADVDGDGDLDVLAASSTLGNTVAWFENFGFPTDADGNRLVFDQRGEDFDRIVGGRVDMGAFESTGFDFGDAPLPFATTLADNGAGHMLLGPTLGSLRDADLDGVNSEFADADGNDEDGITFGVAELGFEANVLIEVEGGPAKVDAWIDFDRNGEFTPEEQIFTSTEVVAGDNLLTFSVPKTATPGDTVARFRLSTEGGLAPFGIAKDGEVEDYLVSLLPQSLVQVPLNYNFNGIVHADEPAAIPALTIDDFQVLDIPNNFAATSIGSSVITVEVADNNGGTVANAAENRYDFFAPNVGDTFVARYDWPGVFADLPGASVGQFIQTIPLGNFDGDWTLTIDNGTGSPVSFATLPPSTLPNPIELDSATFLQFSWTFLENSGADGFGSFGAVGETSDVGILSSFLALDPDDPDNPLGYRSISDRGLDFRDGVPEHPILDRYDLVSEGGDLDIVHLGNRDTVDRGRRSFESEVDGDSRGVQPDWLTDVDQSGRQSTILPEPILLGADSEVELIFQYSNGGGSFDVVVGLSDGTEVVSTVTGPDWFAPFNGQPNIGAFPGTQNTDLAIPGPDLLLTEAIVDLGDSAGLEMVSLSFENASNTTGGIAILGANVVNIAGGKLADQIGFRRGARFILDVNGNQTFDGPDVDANIGFGRADDIPVIGDWDGDGFDNLALYRGNRFILDVNGNGVWDGPEIDANIGFGRVGDTPIVGDWDGDGKTNIGVRRGSRFILDINGNNQFDGPTIDANVAFGRSTDTPISGDWDGDGKDNIGVHRSTNSRFILDINGNLSFDGPTIDANLGFGQTGDLPVIGDWNADGSDDLGVRRRNRFILDLNGNDTFDGPEVDANFAFGRVDDFALSGKWPQQQNGTSSFSSLASFDENDTNGDGRLSPMDALLIIHFINSGSDDYESHFDRSMDGMVSPLDALFVINALNRGPNDGGLVAEGEFSDFEQFSLDDLYATEGDDDEKRARDQLFAKDDWLRSL